ncbi:TPA: hypothetical protein HA241_01305 [Candidatus Woesearchaeota archaeon]|nr:hypothetical protein [Candidatus Woesearchaeota archaeon]
MFSKKGQSLSLNVIIVAALALIVLVVLVVIFTGRIGGFDEGLTKESNVELVKLKISYGDCHPTVTEETKFRTQYSLGQSVEEKDQSIALFQSEIDRCSVFTDSDSCAGTSCKWS